MALPLTYQATGAYMVMYWLCPCMWWRYTCNVMWCVITCCHITVVIVCDACDGIVIAVCMTISSWYIITYKVHMILLYIWCYVGILACNRLTDNVCVRMTGGIVDRVAGELGNTVSIYLCLAYICARIYIHSIGVSSDIHVV